MRKTLFRIFMAWLVLTAQMTVTVRMAKAAPGNYYIDFATGSNSKYTATTATLSWVTASSDLITWSCSAF